MHCRNSTDRYIKDDKRGAGTGKLNQTANLAVDHTRDYAGGPIVASRIA